MVYINVSYLWFINHLYNPCYNLTQAKVSEVIGMCEMCELNKAFGKVGTVEIWMRVKRLGDKTSGLWFTLPVCDKPTTYERGYWQGVYHTLDSVLRWSDWVEELRKGLAVEGGEL